MTDFDPGTYTIGKGDWQYNPKFHDFANFLGLIERDAKGAHWKADKDTRDKMGQIYLWGSLKAKSDDHDAIKGEIHNLIRSTGVNWTGKSLVERLWQHTVFDQDFRNQLQSVVQEEKTQKAKPKKRTKTIKKKSKPEVPKDEIEKSVSQVKEQVKKQTQQATQKAVKEAIEEGIKSAFS